MQQMTILANQQYLGAVALLTLIAALAAISWYCIRHTKRRRVPAVVGGYSILVIIVFITGMLPWFLREWAFYIMGYLTAPWSAVLLMLPNGVIRLVTSGWLGNFVFFVVVCGGVNSALLYMIMVNLYRPRSTSDRQDHLRGPQG